MYRNSNARSRRWSPIRRPTLLLGELTAVVLAFVLVAAAAPADDGVEPLPPEGWSVTLSDDYEPVDFVIALRQGGDDRIELLHPWTGAWMATIRTSYGPMVVRRPSAGQLIISDLLQTPRPDGGIDSQWRVLIFDVTDGLALVREFPIEFRVGYKIYWPGSFGLSGDGRYLFYRDHRMGEDSKFCDGPGSACDETRWVAIDLEDPGAEHRRIITTNSCGSSIIPGPDDSAMVSCGATVRIAGTGEVLEEARGSGLGVPFRASDGTLGSVSATGAVSARTPSGDRLTARALPPDSQLMQSYAAPDGRILLAYRTRATFVSSLHGVALFDPERLETVRHSGMEVDSAVPRLDGGGVWALRRDGTIVSLSWTARVREWELNNEPLFSSRNDTANSGEWTRWALIP